MADGYFVLHIDRPGHGMTIEAILNRIRLHSVWEKPRRLGWRHSTCKVVDFLHRDRRCYSPNGPAREKNLEIAKAGFGSRPGRYESNSVIRTAGKTMPLIIWTGFLNREENPGKFDHNSSSQETDFCIRERFSLRALAEDALDQVIASLGEDRLFEKTRSRDGVIT